MSQLLPGLLGIRRGPVLKVYHGFGDRRQLSVFGHAFQQAPLPQEGFSDRFWKNTINLLGLFAVVPWPGLTVEVLWEGRSYQGITGEDGYFRIDFQPGSVPAPGWHEVKVVGRQHDRICLRGSGRLLIPHPTHLVFVSDIDDTFLISHSSDLRKRLYVLLTRNARTRRPFEGVVEHYQMLCRLGASTTAPHPFFYVSSSEWNLYDYIREFSDYYHMPEGIFQLNALKELHEFWQTGQNKHRTKYTRIKQLLEAYPDRRFVLLGDDSQEDPAIYATLVRDHPGRIVCVYLRHVKAEALPATRMHEAFIKAEGVEICYFTHSRTAMAHTERFFQTGGLVADGRP
jgi:phosphatidate phosphatase APP1